MGKWYYMTKYSFDPSKHVIGPFETEDEAWEDMHKIAIKGYEIDLDNGWDTKIIKDKECGEITIKNFFAADIEVTEFFLFEI